VKIACAVDEIRKMTPNEVKAIFDADRKGEFLLLDVRQPEEYQAGHIPGATLIPLGELEARQGELDRSKNIITYCRSGHRSMAAAIALCGMGFKDVQHLDGGILNWTHETIRGVPKERLGLITEAADEGDVLMLAMRFEKGSWDFYLEARYKSELPKAKETFLMLAKAEEGHMGKLHKHARSLFGEKGILPLEQLKRELKVEYMEGGIEITPTLVKVEDKFIDDMGALEIALEKEYMSYDFYKRTSAVVENPDAKMLLHKLASEERNHAAILLTQVQEIVSSDAPEAIGGEREYKEGEH